jgi:hypothetical protein
MLTALALYNMYENGGKLSQAMLVDLFGVMNWPHDIRNNEEAFHQRLILFDGLFKGLYLMKVPVREIESHRRANTLDELIHAKYKGRQSGYYKQFCEQGIVIGRTQVL